jgi:competence protein ComEC
LTSFARDTAKTEIALVRILIPFLLGIFSFYGCEATYLFNYIFLFSLVLFAILLAVNIRYNSLNIHQHSGIIGLAIHLLLFTTGISCVISHKQHIYTDFQNHNDDKYLKIRIINEPQNKQNIILFNAEVTKSIKLTYSLSADNENKHHFHTVSGKIRVSIRINEAIPLRLKYGDELIIPAKFSAIPAPLNPNEFDFKAWLATQDIYHQAFLKPEELIKLPANSGNRLIRFALDLRAEQVAIYRKLIKDDDAFAVASTLILGYRADLSPQMLDTYSKTGTIHALSVSGMHVGLVYLVLNQLLYFLNRGHVTRIIKTILILSLIWFYTLLTGFSPSVLRAGIMISVFIIAKLFNRNTNSYNIIAFAAFCLLLYNPFLLQDVGFQLTFMAVLGLIYLQPKIEGWLYVKNPWLNKIWSTLAMSLAAQLATYPFSVYYFHQFPLYFLLSNLFITLPTALIMYIGLSILLFKLECLGPLFEWLIDFTNNGLDWIASLPFAGISAIWLSKTELVLLCFALTLSIIAIDERRKRLFLIALALFLCLQSAIAFNKLQALQQKKAIRYKLKKNYAVALICSNKAVLFTDLDPESKAFLYFVKPALDRHRVTQIQFRNANSPPR